MLLAVCGFGSYLLVRNDSQVVGASTAPTPTIPKRDISARAVDPVLMTVADVFPKGEINADPSIPPYKISGAAQMATDCRAGATSDLGTLLRRLGCNQVIRGTFKSPDGGYWVTAGIFNLKDDTAVLQAHQQIKALVDTGKGRFTGYVSGPPVRVLGRAPTQLAWDPQGHFLSYCVIARADGKAFAAEDPNVKVIIYDIVETYLRDGVIADWSIDRGAAGPSAPAGSP